MQVGGCCPSAFQTPLSSELDHLFIEGDDVSSLTTLPVRVQSLAWVRTLCFHLFAQHCSYFLQVTKLMIPRRYLPPSVPRLALLRFPPLASIEKGMLSLHLCEPSVSPLGLEEV